MTANHVLAVMLSGALLIWHFWPWISEKLSNLDLSGFKFSFGSNRPSYAQATEALSVIARYKANCGDQPEYKMVLASLKTVEAA